MFEKTESGRRLSFSKPFMIIFKRRFFGCDCIWVYIAFSKDHFLCPEGAEQWPADKFRQSFPYPYDEFHILDVLEEGKDYVILELKSTFDLPIEDLTKEGERGTRTIKRKRSKIRQLKSDNLTITTDD